MSDKIAPATIKQVSYLLDMATAELRKGMPLYAELVCEDSRKIHDWIVLQISGLEWAKFSKPAWIKPEEEWIQTSRVMGFNDKNIQGVHFVKHTPDYTTREYNAGHKGYLLVIESPSLSAFGEHWRVSDYGNAGAIAFVVDDVLRPVMSHVGGLLRMLDIPVVVFDSEMDAESIDKLRPLGENSKIGVFADESIPVGWIRPQ
jgi:hypothetical protein